MHELIPYNKDKEWIEAAAEIKSSDDLEGFLNDAWEARVEEIKSEIKEMNEEDLKRTIQKKFLKYVELDKSLKNELSVRNIVLNDASYLGILNEAIYAIMEDRSYTRQKITKGPKIVSKSGDELVNEIDKILNQKKLN